MNWDLPLFMWTDVGLKANWTWNVPPCLGMVQYTSQSWVFGHQWACVKQAEVRSTLAWIIKIWSSLAAWWSYLSSSPGGEIMLWGVWGWGELTMFSQPYRFPFPLFVWFSSKPVTFISYHFMYTFNIFLFQCFSKASVFPVLPLLFPTYLCFGPRLWIPSENEQMLFLLSWSTHVVLES